MVILITMMMMVIVAVGGGDDGSDDDGDDDDVNYDDNAVVNVGMEGNHGDNNRKEERLTL